MRKADFVPLKTGVLFFALVISLLAFMIGLTDALNIMDEKDLKGVPIPFEIKFVTYDKAKKKGGEIIHLTNAVRCGQKHNMKENSTIGVTQLNNTHHPYAVHIRLILEFNGNKIFY